MSFALDAPAHRTTPTNEDGFAALVEYDGGTVGSMSGPQLAHGSWDDIMLRVDGSRRSAWWDSRHPNQATIAHKLEGVRTTGLESPSSSFEGLVAEVHGRSHTQIAATFADALHNCATIDTVLQSGREKMGWMAVPGKALAEAEA